MKRGRWTIALLMCAFFLSACDASSRHGFGTPPQEGAPDANTRQAIIERLAPGEGLSRARLRAVVEATMRVTNINRSELPDKYIPVREVLSRLTQRELQQIEAILPEVQANPKLQWED